MKLRNWGGRSRAYRVGVVVRFWFWHWTVTYMCVHYGMTHRQEDYPGTIYVVLALHSTAGAGKLMNGSSRDTQRGKFFSHDSVCFVVYISNSCTSSITGITVL